jgi:hypothetical protein
MVQLRLLLLAVGLLVLAPAGPAAAASTECSGQDIVFGCVDSGVAGNAVTLVGQQVIAGTVGGAVGAALAPPPRLTRVCIYDPAACQQDPAGTPPVTLNDIASFRPTPGRQQMEPDGWTVAGLDTNFYAITDPHVVNGTLLGRPADVRFTPVAFHWTYGDGTAATKSTKGGTWAALGIAEFDPTPTSHVYEQLGDYTITLSITFAAEYRFAGGAWRPVVGTITLPANDLYLRVGTAQTVLVEHDCIQNPGGPGC